MRVDEDLFLIMGKSEALFLQKLINTDDSPTSIRLPGDEGFFLCNGEFLAGRHWNKSEQDRHLTRLRRRGFITTKRAGHAGAGRPQRWVFVYYETIAEALERIGSNSSFRGIMMPQYEAVIKKKKNTTYSSSSSRKENSPREPAPPAGGGSQWVRTPAFKLTKPRTQPDPVPPAPREEEEKPMPAPLVACESPAVVRPAVGPDMRLAERYKALAASRGWPPPRNMRQWEGWFAELRSRLSLAGRHQDLDMCLTWYEKAAGKDEGVPSLTTPKKFSDNFEWVLSLTRKNKTAEAEQVEVSAEAEDVAKDLLREYDPPEPLASDLPRIVEITMRNIRSVRAKLRELKKAGNDFAGHVLGSYVGPVNYDLTYEWLGWRLREAKGIERKYGNPPGPGKIIFTWDHPKFDKDVRQMSRNWCWSDEEWVKLKECLKP